MHKITDRVLIREHPSVEIIEMTYRSDPRVSGSDSVSARLQS